MAKMESLRGERPLDGASARSPTLAVRLYTAPEIFAGERKATFFRGWHMAGHVSDLTDRGYCQGRFVVDARRSALSEHAVHHFHRLVAQPLNF